MLLIRKSNLVSALLVLQIIILFSNSLILLMLSSIHRNIFLVVHIIKTALILSVLFLVIQIGIMCLPKVHLRKLTTNFPKHFCNLYDNSFPLRRKRVSINTKRVPRKPWITQAILKSIHRKDKLYRKYKSSPTVANKLALVSYKNALQTTVIRVSKNSTILILLMNIDKSSFFNRIVPMWNQLPIHTSVKCSTSFSVFKNNVVHFLQSFFDLKL